MLLPMHYYGDPVLRKQCAKIKEVTPEIRKLAEDMIETMDAYRGIGLAANQVGKLIRIFVLREEKIAPNGDYMLGDAKVYINPVLTSPSQDTEVMFEGCISFPGMHLEVERPLGITVEAFDINGQTFREEIRGYMSRVIMHENDHINGTLFIDRCSKEERQRVEPILRKIKDKYKPKQ